MTAKPPLSHNETCRSQTPDIRVRVNGEDRRLAAGTALAAYLAAQNVPAQFVAVAVNNEVVRRADHASVVLHDGDVVEVVRMVGGGSDVQSKTHAAPAAAHVCLSRSAHDDSTRHDRQKAQAPCP